VSVDHCDEVGWPQAALPVRKVRAVLISPPMTAADREIERRRVARYRARMRKMQQRCREELRRELADG
jgi:hypothetical protein